MSPFGPVYTKPKCLESIACTKISGTRDTVRNSLSEVLMKRWIVVFCTLSMFAAEASAEEVVVKDGPEIGLGARVGGYGFREVEGGSLSWADCRMNGTGLFGTVDVGKHFFGEVSADLYHSTGSSSGMDRMSFLPSAAVGARLFAGKLITPYIQAGGGPEFTRIEMDANTDKKLLASGFMGIGGELNVKSFHFGSNIKVFSMGIPEHLHGTVEAHLQPEDAPAAEHTHEPAEMKMRYEVAGMMQFFVRYTF